MASRAQVPVNGELHYATDAEATRFRVFCEGSDASHVKYPAAVTDRPVGISVDGNNAAEEAVALKLLGQPWVLKMAGTGSKGDLICPSVDGSGTGKVVPSTACAVYAFARALTDWAADEEIPVETFSPVYTGPQTATKNFSLPCLATAPSSPVPGERYFDTALVAARVYSGSAWQTLQFVLAMIAFLIAALFVTPDALAVDKTVILRSGAGTANVMEAAATDTALVPGNLTISGNLTVTGNLTAAGYISNVSKAFAFGDMTDNLNTTGYIDFTSTIPAGSVVLGWKAVTTTGFTGDTTATIQVGYAGAVGAFSTVTNGSCAAAGTVGSASVLATSFCAAATTARVTITGGADFTSISAGECTVTIFYAK